MTTDVVMPQLGETVDEGRILSWFKAVGDEVEEGHVLFEVETDKVTMEIEALRSGRLSEIRVPEGETAKVGAIVAVIGGDSAATDPAFAASQPDDSPDSRSARSLFDDVVTAPGRHGRAKLANGLRISPLARRLVGEHGLDVDKLAGVIASRSGRKIQKRDVLAYLDSQASKPKPTVASTPSTDVSSLRQPQGSAISPNAIRQRTGEHLTESWRTVPHVFQAVEADFSSVERVRSREKERLAAAEGIALTYLPFLARAFCLTRRAFAHVNGHFRDGQLVVSSDVHLGIAVDLNHDGLVVPVIRGADEMTVLGLARAIAAIVDKARRLALTPDDLADGTYTISNNGAFGTLFTAPIINAPQVAILSIDAIRLRPAVVETAEGPFVAPRRMGMIGQSFDHRAFDGAYAAAFLNRLKQTIESHDWTGEL